MNELVSVITPAYNSENYISDAIESVINQTYSNWEMIIVDDCSTDNTMSIIEEYAKKDNRIITIYLNNNGGVAKARNKAIRLAKGKFIAFLDSDDMWHSDKLLKQVNFMNENNYHFTYTSYQIISAERVQGKIVKVPSKLNYTDALKGNAIACLTVVINKEKVENIEMPLVKHEDYAAWLNILKEGIIAYGLNESLALYRKTDNSLSSNKLKSAKWTWNNYRINQRLPLVKCLYYYVFYIFNSIKKHYF